MTISVYPDLPESKPLGLTDPPSTTGLPSTSESQGLGVKTRTLPKTPTDVGVGASLWHWTLHRKLSLYGQNNGEKTRYGKNGACPVGGAVDNG